MDKKRGGVLNECPPSPSEDNFGPCSQHHTRLITLSFVLEQVLLTCTGETSRPAPGSNGPAFTVTSSN